MPSPVRSIKRSAPSAPGVKMLITAASLVATLGGWALLSGKEAGAAVASVPSPTVIAPAQPSLPASNQPVVQPAPRRAPSLRMVTAPPPVTRTRSSR